MSKLSPVRCEIILVLILLQLLPSSHVLSDQNFNINCGELRMGQYLCSTQIDPKTQQPLGCTQNNVAPTQCTAVEGLICNESGNRTFTKLVPCKWTNGYSYSTALLLSIFFGILGIDRLYLGQLGMAALKLSTLGFLFVGTLVDIILIGIGAIGPQDGSALIVPYYGPIVKSLRSNNETYVVHRPDWFT